MVHFELKPNRTFLNQINKCVRDSSVSFLIGAATFFRLGKSKPTILLNNVIIYRQKVIRRDRSPKSFQSTKVLQVR